ncbi:PocR ligand-binding domain-containing protein [Aneurinibacillus thermoaerophilus]|uniref:sensor histidine kinase n=1 Tax=Aneurinibacillus thermoaerophilus TaxID=143495 RepID=UPI002E1EEB1F|nr:PocR ligand-binding domain-containing protein [Aneurinibacillus thermoaerophilus]MED0737718.1 PocR ligand-binding domain-containing protein [Aneurinibacillus thermoaerophilus]MED0764178.1 PocR ligand-binding domain-containing protein [Aneurinibacillus thermoaerophilus]
MGALTLRDIVDVEVLQEVQDRFADATGFAVIIGDEQGNPITRPSNFTSFCSYIRSCPEGLRRCILSDERVGILAAKKGRPVIHRCHSGLVDLAAPIIHNEKYLGAVLCGQVLMTGHEEEQLQNVYQNISELPLDQGKLKRYLQQITRQDEKKVNAIIELLFMTANYIVKMIVAHIAQQELNERTKQLMEELRIRSELEKMLQDIELQMLQSQMNPHFLFNTLNTISRLAYLEGAEKTQDVTYSLSRILRYSLRKINKLIPVKEEIEYIRHYFFIQQTRYREMLYFECKLDPGIERIHIPFMTLQPLIENAIVHGFEPEGKAMMVRVSGRYEEDKILFEVEDNGKGMQDIRLEDMLSTIQRHAVGHTTGIGIYNIHRRLQCQFGEQYGITGMENGIGKGVKVTITLPRGDLYEPINCG